jgi:hypothetical protein
VSVRPSRLPAALLGAALPGVFLAGCAGTPPQATESSAPASSSVAATRGTDQRIEVEVSVGHVSGDTGRVPVAAGSHVTLVVTSDVADEVHVHGYDMEQELSPGQPAEIVFDATIPGVFEAELHEAGTTLLSLQVS